MDIATLSKQYNDRAQLERDNGSTVEINYALPYVAIDFSNGDSYFFQGEEASNLLNEISEYQLECSDGNILLAIAQNW